MCGIAGSYRPRGGRVPRRLLLEMAGELRHRGPDGTGLYAGAGIGLAATRLAIVDLEGGAQPIANEDETVVVVGNVEIYNHPELRAELRALGHRFRTRCDTEVLVHAYEEWREAALERLNGDFAFALWDTCRRELFLARDRFGVRPLFLAELPGELAFASEARALLRHPRLPRRLDPVALGDTFTLWSLQPDRSAFAGIRQLAPAHWLRLDASGRVEERRWWSLAFDGRAADAGDADAAEELRELLADSVRIRLRADVPVAAYVSGGLDSSAVTALAAREGAAPPASFGIGFADRTFDESGPQRTMAVALGLALEQVAVDDAAVAASFPRVVEAAEQPLLRTAPAPLLRLSRAVRDAGLEVVLTGEGADELFAGYDLFLETKVRRFWARDPGSALRPRLFGRLYPWLGRDLGRAEAFTARFFGRGFEQTGDPLYSHRVRIAGTARCLSLLAPDALAAVRDADPLERLLARLPPRLGAFTPIGRAQAIEIETFLQGYLLHAQGDRMLMANSVEGRFPFLDHRVAEFAAARPDRAKIRGLHEKWLLRRAVAPLLPPEIAGRRKRPYRAPISGPLAGPRAPDFVRELLAPARVGETGLFRPAPVTALLRRCQSGAASEMEEMALVGVLSTMLLDERFVRRPRLAPAADEARVRELGAREAVEV